MTDVGDSLELDIGAVAHGGHCVARHEGRVVFVRHTLPGERVTATVTGIGGGGRHLTADAVAIHEAAPGRRAQACPWSGPGLCGGCDFQHVEPVTQRELKAAVVAEQLQRLAGIERQVVVEAVDGDHDGLGWRTRSRFVADARGHLGLRSFHSHDVVAVQDCPISHPDMDVPDLTSRTWASRSELDVVVDGSGTRLLLGARPARRGGHPTRTRPGHDVPALVHRAGGRGWRVTGAGFWQVHPGAADALVDAVLEGLEPRPGESALDLFAGVGLFAGVLAAAVGPEGRVTAVESDRAAVTDARVNLRDLPGTRVVPARVDASLGEHLPASPDGGAPRVDLVVLDPPRTGARAPVVHAITALAPRRVAYVACDPAALARDLATFAADGYALVRLRAFDLFPMTHHVEAVATLERTGPDRTSRLDQAGDQPGDQTGTQHGTQPEVS